MGIFYLTMDFSPQELDPKAKLPTFASEHEAFMAHDSGKITIHQRIRCRVNRTHQIKSQKGSPEPLPANRVVETTVGRLIFADILPTEMPLYNYGLSGKGAGRVIADCHHLLGRAATIDLLDNIKQIGFRQSTLAGLSFGVHDMRIPAEKLRIIAAAQKIVDRIEKGYQRGAITPMERHNQLIDVWVHAREAVTEEMMKELKADRRDEKNEYVPTGSDKGQFYLNPIFLMTDSGARGSVDQIRQLAGMRGLMAKPSGEIIETPIRSNFREGLNVLEYFSAQDRRLGLPHAKARRRGAKRHRKSDRLRDEERRHQGCDL